MQDEFYLKQLTEQHVFGPLFMTLAETIPRDNLLSSASLDLFEYIRKENLRELMKYLVERFRPKLMELSDFDTFRDMLDQYDMTRGFTINQASLTELEADGTARRPNPGNTRGLMEHLTVDPVEEEYWNGEEDDEEEPRKAEKTIPAANGNATPSKPLVDYASDEEAEDGAEAEIAVPDHLEVPNMPAADQGSSVVAYTPVQAPERLSEKRRREEDDDYDLGQLLQNKRRNSASTNLNASGSAGSALLRKKGSFTGLNSSGNGPTRISISLSPSPQSPATETAISTHEGAEAHG